MATMAEQIKDVGQKIASLEFQLAVERAVLARLQVIEQSNGNGSGARDRVVQGSLTAEMKEVFERLNRRIAVDELIRELGAKGVTSKGKSGLKGAVASVLSKRDDLFTWVSRGLYELKKESKEPAASGGVA